MEEKSYKLTEKGWQWVMADAATRAVCPNCVGKNPKIHAIGRKKGINGTIVFLECLGCSEIFPRYIKGLNP